MPFVLAVLMRIVVGRSRLTRTLISLGTMWFLINVLLAPYSARMRQDIYELHYILR